jgi:hypothetical protein
MARSNGIASMAWCQGSCEKRFAGLLRSMAVMFAREGDQSTYCCELPLAMLLSLAAMCTALPLTARADSATQNIVSSTIIDASCKISLTPIDYPLNGAVPRRRSEVAATCGRYSYLGASSPVVGSNGETGTYSKLIGYAASSCAGWRGFCAPYSTRCSPQSRTPNQPENRRRTVLQFFTTDSV